MTQVNAVPATGIDKHLSDIASAEMDSNGFFSTKHMAKDVDEENRERTRLSQLEHQDR